MSRLLLDLSAMNVSSLLLDLSAMRVRSVRISSFFGGKIHSTPVRTEHVYVSRLLLDLSAMNVSSLLLDLSAMRVTATPVDWISLLGFYHFLGEKYIHHF